MAAVNANIEMTREEFVGLLANLDALKKADWFRWATTLFAGGSSTVLDLIRKRACTVEAVKLKLYAFGVVEIPADAKSKQALVNLLNPLLDQRFAQEEAGGGAGLLGNQQPLLLDPPGGLIREGGNMDPNGVVGLGAPVTNTGNARPEARGGQFANWFNRATTALVDGTRWLACFMATVLHFHTHIAALTEAERQVDRSTSVLKVVKAEDCGEKKILVSLTHDVGPQVAQQPALTPLEVVTQCVFFVVLSSTTVMNDADGSTPLITLTLQYIGGENPPVDMPWNPITMTVPWGQGLLSIAEDHKADLLRDNHSMLRTFEQCLVNFANGGILAGSSTGCAGGASSSSAVAGTAAGGRATDGPRTASQTQVRHEDPLHKGKFLLLLKNADTSLLYSTVIFRRMCSVVLQTCAGNLLPCHVDYKLFFNTRFTSACYVREVLAAAKEGGTGYYTSMKTLAAAADADSQKALEFYGPLVEWSQPVLQRAFIMLCTRGFCTLESGMFSRAGTLNLSLFGDLRDGDKLLSSSSEISRALLRFEKFLVFTLSLQYDKVFDEVRQRLDQGDLWNLGGACWETDFILWHVEISLHQVFRTIREGVQARVLEFEQVDIAGPGGVAQ